MKARFGLAALDAIKKNYDIFLERLIKGYEKVTGKKPEGLDLTMIKREAYEKAEDSAKVVDMEGKTLDPSKPIMGGRQDFGEGIRKIYDEAKGPGKGDEMVEALKSPGARKSTEIIEKQIQETFPDIKLFGDETFEEILEIQRTGKHPRMKADGGRINFRTGGPTGVGSLQSIIGADLMGPSLGSLGGIEEEDEFANIQGQTAGLGVVSALKGLGVIGDYLINQGRTKVYNRVMDMAQRQLEQKKLKEAAEKAAAARVATMAANNRALGTGGYQSSFGQDTDFMSGSGTAAEMGSFADGGIATMFVERR